MNLAPWKYRNILVQDHGPLQTLQVEPLQSPYLNSIFEAYATLDPSVLTRAPSKEHQLYGAGDGTGTSPFQNIAQYKAISEALERWAFYETVYSEHAGPFGFDRDYSTNGMASFPGLTKSESRTNAMFEAMERWSLCAWWEGYIQARQLHLPSLPFQAAELITPWTESSAVIIWSQIPNSDQICYGFSCARTSANAIQRALVELDRNRRVLDSYFKTKSQSEVSEGGEQRLVFFASQKGHALFMNRMESSFRSSLDKTKPTLIVDLPLPGPWTKYTSVWRCLFEPFGDGHGGEQLEYFFF